MQDEGIAWAFALDRVLFVKTEGREVAGQASYIVEKNASQDGLDCAMRKVDLSQFQCLKLPAQLLFGEACGIETEDVPAELDCFEGGT